MTTTLTATALTAEAAVRLRLESTTPEYAPVEMTDFADDAELRDAELARWSVVGPPAPEGEGLSVYPYDQVTQWPYTEIERRVLWLPAGPDTDPTTYATRTLTGLTAGQRYRVSLAGFIAAPTTWELGIDGIGSRTVYPTPADGNYPQDSTAAWELNGPFTYEFVATATTHQLRVRPVVTPGGSYAALYFSAIRVDRIPGPLAVTETDFPAAEDASWTVAGTPAGASSSVTSATLEGNPNRWYARTWTRTSGSPNLQNSSVRRVVTGLTVGKSYTVRAAVRATATLDGTETPFHATLGVLDVGAADSATWPSWRWVGYTFTATATSHTVILTVAQNVTLASAGDSATIAIDYLRVEEYIATGLRTLASLTRSDANGARSVRLYLGQDLAGGQLIVTDFEPALAGRITYTAVVDVEGGPQERATASLAQLGSTLPVLAPATLPQYGRTVDLVTGFEGTRNALTTVHDIVGRADPLVVFGPLGTRRGTIDIFIAEYATGVELQGVYELGEVVLLRQPTVPGLDLYHVATGLRLGQDASRWRLTVSYVEVAAPTGPLLGAAGWTFDRAAQLYPTFAAASATFPSFNDYTTGPVG